MKMISDIGFLRVAALVPEVYLGDPTRNCTQLLWMLNQAEKESVQLAVFPELCLCGTTCGDLFLQPNFIQACADTLASLVTKSASFHAAFCVGLPLLHESRLYNVCALIADGKVLAFVPKKKLSNTEVRYFSSGADADFSEITFMDTLVPFGTNLIFHHEPHAFFCFAICFGDDFRFSSDAELEAIARKATILCVPTADRRIAGSVSKNKQRILNESAHFNAAVVFASAGFGESSSDAVYSGQMIIAESGECLAADATIRIANSMISADIDAEKILAGHRKQSQSALAIPQRISFRGGTAPAMTELKRIINRLPFIPQDIEEQDAYFADVFGLQTTALARRLKHINAIAVTIGISGGLDSTLALLVCVNAFDQLGYDRKGIHAYSMPGLGTTSRTKNNAQQLCTALGVSFEVIPIYDAVRLHFRDIGQDESVQDATYENAQARERTQILMDKANQLHALMVGTGDLSEIALGWCTFNGDQMAMYSVNSSVPKTLLRAVVRWLADSRFGASVSDVLIDITETPISPELVPADGDNIAQFTEAIIGPYELHDFFLYYFVVYSYSLERISVLAEIAFCGVYSQSAILKWLRIFLKRFITQQFKRSAMPDGASVTAVSLSPRRGWEMPSDVAVDFWMRQMDRLERTDS